MFYGIEEHSAQRHDRQQLNNAFFEDVKFNAEFHTLQLREQRNLEVKEAIRGSLG
jgi:hypothetical protein